MKKLSVLVLVDLAAAVGFFVVAVKFNREYWRISMLTILILTLLLFFCVLFIGIHKEVDYIRKINEELSVLEGGDLSREITIKGSDEITALAESVDEFRKSMKNQLETIEQLEKSNRLMAAEIAHDLRTPLTSQIMYLDFALSELEGKEPQVRQYLQKAKEKSVRLKDLMDENFNYMTMPDYFLASKQKVQAYEILSSYLGDMMTYLETEGFYVRSDINYGHGTILIQKDAVARVFNNLLSNIMKYADVEEEVHFCCRDKGEHIEIQITNTIRQFEEEEPEGTGFGARIVKRLMEEMDGQYSAEEKDGIYTTILRFTKV